MITYTQWPNHNLNVEFIFHFVSDPRGFKVENIRQLDEEEKLEYGDSDDEEFKVALPLKKSKPKRVRNYKNKMENWENAEVLLCTIFSRIWFSVGN